MDDKQFAEITKAISQETTRRGALARFAGGLAAALTGTALTAGAIDAKGKKGRKGRKSAGKGQKTAGKGASGAVRTRVAVECDDPRVGAPSGDGVCPTFVDGNPTCEDLGYALGIKVDPPTPGTYDLVDCAGNKIGEFKFTSADGVYFDWTSTFGIDAVVSKGGSNANVYEYDDGTGDTSLHSPLNPNGEPAGISHINVCYDVGLKVTKTAETAFTRTYTWTIDKTCPASITVAAGQTYTLDYDVTPDATSADSGWTVSGVITIVNPSCDDAEIKDVTDAIAGTDGEVDCGVNFPYTLPAGEKLECEYTVALGGANDGTNTATVTVTDDSAVGGGEGSAEFEFGDPTTVVDECIAVSDSLAGAQGGVCVDDLPTTIEYTYDVSFDECGEHEVVNTASFVTNDTELTGSDTCTTQVTVPCDGCTLTQGYWKTHSRKGPAPYDNAWQNLGPLEENTVFFLSGKTYYQVLWTPPAGNPYYTLAHQYIAAQLNMLNGASVPPAVKTAFDAATALFKQYTPAQVAGSSTLKSKFQKLVGTLDDYNNGVTGPGHCDDNSSEVSIKRAAGGGAERSGKKRGKGKGKGRKNGRK